MWCVRHSGCVLSADHVRYDIQEDRAGLPHAHGAQWAQLGAPVAGSGVLLVPSPSLPIILLYWIGSFTHRTLTNPIQQRTARLVCRGDAEPLAPQHNLLGRLPGALEDAHLRVHHARVKESLIAVQGRICLERHTLPRNKSVEHWFPLHPTENIKGVAVTGAIQLRVDFKVRLSRALCLCVSHTRAGQNRPTKEKGWRWTRWPRASSAGG
jgi:hypothetical protein